MGSRVDSLTLLAPLARLLSPLPLLASLSLPLHLLYRGPSLFCTSESRGFLRVGQVVDFLPDRFVEPRGTGEKETVKFNFVLIWLSKVGTWFCASKLLSRVLLIFPIYPYLIFGAAFGAPKQTHKSPPYRHSTEKWQTVRQIYFDREKKWFSYLFYVVS